MLERLRQSLAFRLAAGFALLFAVGSAAIFGVLYWALARSLEARDRIAVEQMSQRYAQAYEHGGIVALSNRVNDDPNRDEGALLVRLIDQAGESTIITAPPAWIDPHAVLRFVPFGWVGWRAEELHSVRIPQNAAKDFAVVSRALPDGHLLQVARRTDSQAVLLAPLRRDFATVGTAALLLSLIVGMWLAWRTTRPLREMAATARRIVVEDDHAARVPAPAGTGELALLARQLNTLLDKNAEHVRVLRETLDNLAHDLRTPLTRLRGTAELALQDTGDPVESRQALAGVVDESDRVLHLLEALLDVSAAEAGVLALRQEPIELRRLVQRGIDVYFEVAEERRIALEFAPGPPVEMMADPVRLGQAVSNLLDNALKYTPEGGRVNVAASEAAGDGGPWAEVTVDDTGPGVPEAERESIWRRLYRGDASRSQRGLGLGLTLVRAVVVAHGGSAAVGTAPEGGARFVLRLPIRPNSKQG